MKRIKLNGGHVALVDDDDYDRLAAFHWTAKEGRNTFYAIRTVYDAKSQSSKAIRMHREIMGVSGLAKVDHRNRNGLDNRRRNLRTASNVQNCANSPKRKQNTSGFKGVYFCTKTNRWRARLETQGVRYHIGRFDTPRAASIAYRKFHREMFGEFSS